MSTLDNPPSIHFHYPLKPSRLAKLFQWGCLLLILFVIYHIHSFFILLLSAVLGVGYIYYRSQRICQQVVLLSHLDQSDWSVQYLYPTQVKRIQVDCVLDYKLYFVILIKQSTEKNLVIWYDQLQRNSLKSLKIRAKLN